MKIRIKGNSLRYRLTRSEVDTFKKEKYITDQINFGNQALKYILKQENCSHLTASFEDDTIILAMPVFMAEEWTNTERVGFEFKGAELYLLVEKDFKCLDTVSEDQSDNYPNPLGKD